MILEDVFHSLYPQQIQVYLLEQEWYVGASVLEVAVGTALSGLSDVGEGITDYNVIQEAVFMGNENAYNITEIIFITTATFGSIICGGYIKYNTTTTPRSLPGKC